MQANTSDCADQHGTDVYEADLEGTDLEQANLTDAIVTNEQLAQAKRHKGATMPDGNPYTEDAPTQGYSGGAKPEPSPTKVETHKSEAAAPRRPRQARE